MIQSPGGWYDLQVLAGGCHLWWIRSTGESYLMGEATGHNRIACKFAHITAGQLPNLNKAIKYSQCLLESPARQYYTPPSGVPWWSGTAGDRPLRLRCSGPCTLGYDRDPSKLWQPLPGKVVRQWGTIVVEEEGVVGERAHGNPNLVKYLESNLLDVSPGTGNRGTEEPELS